MPALSSFIKSRERGHNKSWIYDWYGLFDNFFESEGNLFFFFLFCTKTLWVESRFPLLKKEWLQRNSELIHLDNKVDPVAGWSNKKCRIDPVWEEVKSTISTIKKRPYQWTIPL